VSLDIDAIRARADAATVGPWHLVHPDSSYSALSDNDQLPVAMSDGQMVRADAEFIAAAVRAQIAAEAHALVLRFGGVYHADSPGAMADDIAVRIERGVTE
jgi:hypothetical protein